MLAGLDSETAAIVGTIIGTAVVAIFVNLKGLKRAEKSPDPAGLTVEHLDDEIVDVKGEVRQGRQETRLEHKETRALVCNEHRETRDGISGLRDLLIEIRAEVRHRD